MKLLYFIRFCTLFITFFSGFAIATPQIPDVEIVPTPNWVKPENITTKPLSELRKPSHYYLVEQKANNAELKKRYFRYAYAPSDTAGLNDYSTITIRFNPAYETLKVHNVSVSRDGQVITQIKAEDIQVINAEDSQSDNIFSGEYDALVQLKNVQAGDLIDYSYSIVGANPVFDQHFVFQSRLAWGVGIDKLSVFVVSPINKPLNYKLHVSQDKLKLLSTQKELTYQIYLENVKALHLDDKVPGWYRDIPYIEFSDYQSWQDVAKWANNLFKVQPTDSKEYQRYIESLKKVPLKDAINQAINFVQNDIRYLGLELAENSHKPHSPQEVFANRYGDCKDKSLLLTELLKAIGIDAQVALVSTQIKRGLEESIASHSAFDHAIVRLTYQGKDYWIDPTATYQGTELSEKYQFNYERALIISDTSKNLVNATPVQGIATVELTELIIAADYFSPVEWRVKTIYTGNEAEYMRYKLATRGKDKIAKQYLNYYAKTYPNLSPLADLKVEDDLVSNRLVMEELYLVPDFWQLTEDKNAAFELTANYSKEYLTTPDTIIRKAPLHLNNQINVSHRVILQLPENIDFSEDDSVEIIDNPYIQFISSIEYDRRRIAFENILKVKASEVEVDQVADYLADIKSINNQMSYSNSITNVTLDPGYKQLKALLSLLQPYAKNQE
ncbi:DUF3857 domain-containing protein [Catenovulum sp. 2E275]|uniref:DUF3857 domain-containing transglutaminase family protein n=1 Tax=Catenovulum sp. 2E275 TaxID=2980497 RepID=UPI0021CFB5E0|nr:DUF3857 domain-containing protein [Catenovulum sp. 2E275]MCU4674568.1 DUF3857 domain-containing protein [Catenovulum sp. 2E275]